MKYLITGGSGYIGSRLTDLLVQHEDNEVVNLDIRAPAVPRSRTRFVHMDIRDRGIAALIAQERPDALVHLAFVLNPIRDEHTMYDIDVNGTANVLDAAAAAGYHICWSHPARRHTERGRTTPCRSRRNTPCVVCRATSTPATRPRSTVSASSGRHSTPRAR